jgi:hypothetical protein
VLRERDEDPGAETSPVIGLEMAGGVLFLALLRVSPFTVRKNICGLLGIRRPIPQGGMFWIADATLASSDSNADALGTFGPYAGIP